MIPINKSVLFILLAAALMVIAPASPRVAFGADEKSKDTELSKKMEDIQDNLKKLRRTVKDAANNKDTLKASAWEKSFTAPMRFNRLILFSPWLFHNSARGFGDSPETGRLAYLMFFAAA